MSTCSSVSPRCASVRAFAMLNELLPCLLREKLGCRPTLHSSTRGGGHYEFSDLCRSEDANLLVLRGSSVLGSMSSDTLDAGAMPPTSQARLSRSLFWRACKQLASAPRAKSLPWVTYGKSRSAKSQLMLDRLADMLYLSRGRTTSAASLRNRRHTPR